jgi:hypothetical protein
MEFVDTVENALFRKVRLKGFASGENAHTLPIDEDVLKRGALTVYNKPILWKYNPYTDDANAHDEDEVPCGFIPETTNKEENKLSFERSSDGRLWMVINALIWTKYCGRLIEIFKRDGYKKDVSIEIVTKNDEEVFGEKPKVLDFVVAGITILGEWIDPACKGAEAEMLAFSADKKAYIDSLNFDGNTIKINNSKEAAVDGKWENPRRKLFNPIINASNKKALLKEAYLIYDDSDNVVVSDCKYPHHVIRNGELVLHIRGLQAAFSRASQQGIVSGNIKAHLLRHYKELGLNTENFADFGLTKEQLAYFAETLERVGENEMDNEKDLLQNSMTEENMSEENEDTKCTEEKCTEEKCAEEKCAEDVIEESDDKIDDNVDDTDDTDDKEDKEEFSIEKLMGDVEALKAIIEEQKCALEAMSDYEELKKFKEETLAKEAQEAEIAKMNQVMAEIQEKGVEISKEDKDAFMAEVKNFASIDAWSNYVKATAFDKVEKIDDIIRIADTNIKKSTSGSLWDRI